ncbi:vegetative cell wall protein gp1 [Pyrus ussuriensis x Pyrus communis]|uniref:Vegetative cell wall protein gp1 n=1 Tax=Pyrus ussuriensis x Pyrus communis TaxID=2448454 RepID=A0A5N5F8D2_9ROSA|nr:vegetative cell wall protein gp1 [Pyrus ussuriensis x Pyrus communis]
MDPRCYTQTPLIILFFFIFGFNSAQAVCKPRDLKLRYLTIPSPSPSSPNSQASVPPSKPQPGQVFPSSRPAGPPPTRSSTPAPTPSPNPPSQPPQASPPAGNSISPSSSSSFLRRSSDSPRGNLFAQPFVLNTASSSTPPNPAIQELCKNTDYPDLCILSLTPFQTPKVDPVSALGMTIKACTAHAQMSLAAASKLVTMPNTARGTIAALSDCKDLYSDALDGLQSAIDAIQSHDIGTINSMLSGVVTDAVTCGDGFEGEQSPLGDYDDKLRKMASNCLAIASLIK